MLGYDLVYDVTTGQTWTGTCGHNLYPSTTTFLTTDANANVYFEVNNVSTSDQITNQWIAPDNTIYSSSYWDPATGNRCYESTLNIAGNSPASLPGTWHARIFANGSQLFDLPFTIDQTPIEPRGPNYQGYFDGVDCSHIFGWAADVNNPATTVTVDIYMDKNRVLSSFSAGDYRSDLPEGGYHAFNEYILPAGLTDGKLHTLNIRYSGTNIDLTNSPKTFQNACTSPSGGISLSWAAGGQPPSIATNGQIISLGWSVTGPAEQSRVIYAVDATPSSTNPQNSTKWHRGGDATFTESLALPTATGGTAITFIIQAQANGLDYFSAPTVTNIGSAPNTQTWTYNSSTVSQGSTALNRFTVFLERTKTSSTIYQYRVTVVGQDSGALFGGGDLSTALVVLDRPIGVTAVNQSFITEVNYNQASQIIASHNDGWQSYGDNTLNSELSGLTDSLAGFIPLYGQLKDASGALGNFGSAMLNLIGLTASAPNVPESNMRIKLQNINEYHHDTIPASAKIVWLPYFQARTYGFRFSFQVNEQQQLLEEILVKIQNTSGAESVLEIGLGPSRTGIADIIHY